MATKTKINFHSGLFGKEILRKMVNLQTSRLIEYAESNIRLIGDAIMLYNSRNRMDRTGNLLNSLCWGLSYDGKLKAHGFYRPSIHKSYKDRSGVSESESYLHEFWEDYKYQYPVDGRKLAQQYIKQYGSVGASGQWRLFFAILAPYWGYWEKGFLMHNELGHGDKFLRFQVMTQFYDKVERELKPAQVTFDVKVPQYTHSHTLTFDNGAKVHVAGSLEKRYKRWFEGKFDPYKRYKKK